MNRRQLLLATLAATAAQLAGCAQEDEMTSGFDHLAEYLTVPLAGPSQDVRYRQGTVVSWNPGTLENVIEVGGTQLINLPVLGVGEATLITPGSSVGLIVVGDEGSGKTMAIIGRLVTPNTAQAQDAVSLLNSQIVTDFVGAFEEATSTSFVDLATVGPTVTVNVGPNGRLLILAVASCSLSHSATGAGVAAQAALAVWLSGANIYQPSASGANGWMAKTHSLTVSSGVASLANTDSLVFMSVIGGLNEGQTTLTLKYQRTGGTANRVVFFGNRGLTVFKL